MNEFLATIGPTVWFGAKILVLVGEGLYLVFAFVLIRQVTIMTKTLELGLESVIIIFAYLHLFFAFGVTLASIVLL